MKPALQNSFTALYRLVQKIKTTKLILLLATVLVAGVVSISIGAIRKKMAVTPGPQRKVEGAKAIKPSRVSRSALRGQLGWALNELGNRLERPGKERAHLNGTLTTRNGDSASAAVVNEFPDRMRLNLATANKSFTDKGSNKTLIFDQDSVKSARRKLHYGRRSNGQVETKQDRRARTLDSRG